MKFSYSTQKITQGNKTATFKPRLNGYGEAIIRVTVVQTYNDGLQNQERFIAMKDFHTMKSATNWAHKQF